MGHFDLGPQLSALAGLKKAIEAQTNSTDKQSIVMTRLTWAAVILAIVQTGASVIQLWLTFR
ncbi:hypothetical protein [Geomonas anaerohicana]|uniref:Uncharacterized protein n=1 Tax=Geomonas anaerohicana TaxID=2798583 RepID=A0ABS0YJ05_9BACT|nr:hypothetical protein [Geomonas anaerohicana]MBJ6752322.1 hypothetical protein [Geomonas anaerohicana]